ncbi:MAG: hypothetical protein JOZ57_12500, partial [Abitibacteriaceae bacterium]|nr:hypothetical protein [Abditibacteriaceae bacterium]
GTRQRDYFIGFWISLALAVLAKGPVAVVLVGTPIFCYLWLCGQWPVLSKMQWLIGVPLFFLITAPWFTLVAQRNPEFNHFFWYRQHIGRYLGRDKDREHEQSFSYFFKFLPLMLFPWSAFLPGAVVMGWKKVWPARTEAQRALIYLLLNAIFIVFFFSGSTSKLLTYVLPAVPFCALLFAAYFDWLWRHQQEAWQKPLFSGVTLLSLILGIAGVVCLSIGPKKLYQIEKLSPAIAVVGGIFLLLWTVALIVSAQRRHLPGTLAVVGGGMALLTTGMMPVIAAMAPNHYCKSLLEYIRPGLKPETKIVMYDSYAQSVNFYTGKRIIVKELGELKFGAENMLPADQKVWFLNDMQDLHRLLLSPQPVYCFARDHEGAQEYIKAFGGDVQEIIWNKRRSILGNRAALALTPPKPGGLLGQ